MKQISRGNEIHKATCNTITLEDTKWFGYQWLRLNFVIQMSFTISNSKLYLGSGCSKYMNRDKKTFSDLILLINGAMYLMVTTTKVKLFVLASLVRDIIISLKMFYLLEV